MKVEGFVASLRNAETIGELFKILQKKGVPIVELDGKRFLIIVEGDFEGRKFWTEINGEKANQMLGDAMLNSASFPFKCKKPYTGGNAIFVAFDDIEADEFLVAYRDEDYGIFYRVKDGKAEEITKEEYEELKDKIPEFKVKGFSEEQMDMMGAFFG
ncbi:hypothetical protein, conserved [Thermococcus onnurineus NA1]|uniref:Uncharacterized protein n=1 Tax=Thermococcus onnurineus (strain NA1) TaxID=523850 RepID=B6YTM0_THEON|nr:MULTISPECIES: hypothetical protein [Thermococcus]ACJ15907.1 hypothetical protein, conserved [Thermococcus onnurineus NA1]NJE46404.1 hypothetical protein [Thermococcus sp. GR7]NJE77677.1 hypothetical protein [Thermococcus sp. GR4]NJF23716.1 hypothetical protein [Thermococcus sp. GR5]